MSIGKMTVAKFCDEHNACADGKAWAIKTGAANMAALWVLADMRIEWRLWIFVRIDVDKKTAVRFAVFCARQNWHLLTDPRSKDAIETVERWLDGKATMDEVNAARAAAWSAWSAWATSDAARAAAWSAWSAWSAAWSAARDAQSEWIIKNVEI